MRKVYSQRDGGDKQPPSGSGVGGVWGDGRHMLEGMAGAMVAGSTADKADHEAAAAGSPENVPSPERSPEREVAFSPEVEVSVSVEVEMDGPRASPQPNRPRGHQDASYSLKGFAAGNGDAGEMTCGAPGRPRPSAGGGDNQPPDADGGEGGAADANREEARPPAGAGGVTSGLRHCYVGCEASAAATGEGGLGGGTLARGPPSPGSLRHGRPTDVPVG